MILSYSGKEKYMDNKYIKRFYAIGILFLILCSTIYPIVVSDNLG